LQQVAQQMGIAGTARMRKSQLIAAIQEKQGGSAATEPRRSSAPSADRPAASSEVATAAAGSEVSASRAASAGADASRPLKQDAMETQTSTETGSRRNGRAGSNGVQASSRGDQGGQQLSFDSGPAAAAASAGSAAPQAASGGSETATESPRGDGQHADAPRGDRRRRSNNGRDGQQTRGRGDNNRARCKPDPAGQSTGSFNGQTGSEATRPQSL
jgi:transcription termination factor Rho